MPLDGKTDMDRVGLFKEMGYISIGDKYTPYNYRPFNESAHKNKQMLVGVPKTKSGLQGDYFDSQFRRIFEREALTDPLKLNRQYKLQQAKKNIGKAFLPSNGQKKPSGAGSYYGTLSGPIPATSALKVPKKPYVSPGKNILTNPLKKGSGYSYPNVTLSKMELYTPDPYNRTKEMLKKEMMAHKNKLTGGPFRLNFHPRDCFESNPYKIDSPLPPVKSLVEKSHLAVPFKPSSPSKRIGGMKAGTFDPYPPHLADPYVPRRSASATTGKEGKVFLPSPGPKSTPVKSILQVNVNRVLNAKSYTSVPSVMAY